MPPKPQSSEEKALKTFLTSLGLSPDEANVYKTLCDHGALTTLELARKTAIPRTRVYRTLEKLRSQKLVEEIIDEHRTLAQAVPPDHLDKLVKQKQDQVEELTRLYPRIENYLNQQINRRQPDTIVKYYKGINGIKQMATNVLGASHETVGYTQSVFELYVGKKFAYWLFEEMYINKIFMRDIFSDSFLKSVKEAGRPGIKYPEPFEVQFESRYLPPDKLNVIHTMDIYNNVVAYYDWQGPESEVFGVEIYNPKVAAMQRQIFEILWKIATPEADLLKKSPIK